MAVFGAGAHTRWLLSVTADLPAPPIECIIDDDPVDESIQGIPVRRPEDVDVASLGLVLVSSDRWETELTDRCRRLWGDRVELVRLYEGLPTGPYDKSDDQAEALRQIGDLTARHPGRCTNVVMVTDRPGPREAKIGFALRQAGWKTSLISRKPPPFDVPNFFDEVQTFSHPWEALRLASERAPAVYHVMVNSDYRVAEVFLRHRPGIVVIDPYDVIAGMLSERFLGAHPDFVDQLERERFCLENADGVCCRSREVEFLEHRLGYRVRRRLLFPDGCWNTATPPDRPKSDELHTVYAGQLGPVTARSAAFGGHRSKLWQAETLADQAIHFHLYPWCELSPAAFEEAFCRYRDLEQATPYFHLHHPVPPDRLVAELCRYDLAMFAYNEFVADKNVTQNYTPDKFRVATSNKIFDFIDAGLPVAYTSAEGSFMGGLLDAHGIRIDLNRVDPGGWGVLLRSLDLNDLRSRTALARKDYDIRRQVHRLTEFYSELRPTDRGSTVDTCTASENNEHANDRSAAQPAVV